MPPFGSFPPYAPSKRTTVPSSLPSRSVLWEQTRKITPRCSFRRGLRPTFARSPICAASTYEHQSHVSIAGG
eukprot:6179936-Pleurochrysis_carterae.AAC.1